VATIEFYTARAEQCGRDAAATTLANVREQQLNAQLAWLEMAERLERTTTARETAAAAKAHDIAA
jgi:hypothetical protein